MRRNCALSSQIVEIMFPEIRLSLILFKKILSIRGLEFAVAQNGGEIYYGRKFYIMNHETNHCLYFVSYITNSILKSPISTIVLSSFENFWNNSER